jgi:hypothetical protein
MAYTAATTEGVLLKYLLLKSAGSPSDNIDVAELIEDIRRVQDRYPEIQIYKLSESTPVQEVDLLDDISYLHELGFVCYDPSNPHVRLREWGRFYAELFELPLGLTEKLASAVGYTQSRLAAPARV